MGDGALELFTSEALLAELAGILGRAKFAVIPRRKNLQAAEIVARYRELAETVDAAVLACAVAARADAIVTGDGDLHALGDYRGFPVLSLAQALRRIAAA